MRSANIYKGTHWNFESPEFGKTEVMFLPSHRKMKLLVPRNEINIEYRFTGHHNISLNSEGITTFMHPEFQSELACLLGETNDRQCQKPDIIIVNSGLHDGDSAVKSKNFTQHVVQLAERLRQLNARTIWKGTFPRNPSYDPVLSPLDSPARLVFDMFGMRFFNSSNVILQVKAQAPLGTIFGDTYLPRHSHVGTIGFHNSRVRGEKTNVDMSILITYALLSAIC